MGESAAKVSCVLMGDEALLVQCGSILHERGHTISAVVTASAAVKDWADAEGLPVFSPDACFSGALNSLTFDWFFSIANLRIVPDHVWQRARSGAVNFHDGPLPRYAGLNAPAWALMAGETEFGITWHLLADRIDDGDILVQTAVAIEAEDTALTLNTKCFEAGMAGFGALIDRIEQGDVQGLPQSRDGRTYFAKNRRPPASATIDIRGSVAAADALIRALDFGHGYANPLALPKIMTRHGAFSVVDGRAIAENPGAEAGTVVHVDADEVRIALSDGVVVAQTLADASGSKMSPSRVFSQGEVLPATDASFVEALDRRLIACVADEEVFSRRLIDFEDMTLPGLRPAAAEMESDPELGSVDVASPIEISGARGVASVVGFLIRLGGEGAVNVAFADDQLAADAREWRGYIAPTVPLMIHAGEDVDVDTLVKGVAEELAELKARHGYAGDLVSRLPGLDSFRPTVGLLLTDDPGAAALLPGTAVTIAVPSAAGAPRVLFDRRRLPDDEASAMARRFSGFVDAFSQSPSASIASLPLMTAEEFTAIIADANKTQRDYDRDALIHTLFAAQVERTPDAVAVVCGGESLTYAELDRRADRVAFALRRAGVKPDGLVGLYMARSLELVVGALAILKAGGAYVPLDPTYPADRIALMIADSGCPIVLTTGDLKAEVPDKSPQILTIEDAMSGDERSEAIATPQGSDSLAYVIYTSGSTGRPKGVMVEHRNVVNFFAGMDDRIPVPADSQPVWLAVTSLSFDISVLELLWTLTRGFKVVVHAETPAAHVANSRRARARKASGGMEFSLFYWGNDASAGSHKYQLLLEGARFADTHGFCAVWTPERHFHAFGGPYPNPAVTGAAVAAVTRNLDIRAGSCVLPLHHVARVAEEWAVIDNLSSGRAGIAVASGWMPEDFLLRPENAPPHNKTAMLSGLETLRRLWRGEAVSFDAPNGKTVDIVTQPRPVQSELPVWVTTAGNPDTYRDAARNGANVLTHLLGQSIAEVADKIRIYRETLVECGRNPGDYKVTLMLHTLVGRDREEVRELAREPMKDYLRSAAALIKQYAWAFPAFKRAPGVSQPNDVDLQSVSKEDLDAIIEFAFLRYFDDSGLFGTVDDALARVEQLKAIGVDEIACLIDYGVSSTKILGALEPLAEVVAASSPNAVAPTWEEDASIGSLVLRHGVTHMQCTPSMAAMMLSSDEDRAALAKVGHLFIGGEALQGALLREISAATSATVENMYGPTETTIWSATGAANPTTGTVPLGSPIANTQLYILDDKLRPLPAGMAGELFIGGGGVTRGYLHREDLTRERFLPDPFVQGGRMYRTGDLVRRSADGTLEFLGRMDFQVKVRGYRIELGEIESCLGQHPGIAEAVVLAREDNPGDVRIVAYLRPTGADVPEDELRTHVRAFLTDYMIPAHFVSVEKFPLTPNGKIDRKALRKPGAKAAADDRLIEHVAPTDEIGIRVADIFKRALGVEKVGMLDNFFTLGGHSLLAIQVHRELKKSVASNLSITDLYRFPTVGGLSAHILDRGQASNELDRVASRAAARRHAMASRRQAQRI